MFSILGGEYKIPAYQGVDLMPYLVDEEVHICYESQFATIVKNILR